MAEFVYRAVAKNGKEKKGNIEAENSAKASERLKNQGMMPLEIRDANMFTKEIDISFGKKVGPRDISVFCRQFVSMLSAGVSIIDALGMLSQQTENKYMAKAIRAIQGDIGKGETLSNAMRMQDDIFPDIMVSMIAAGEASGKMEDAMSRMAEHFEKEAKLKGLIKKAAMYPIIVAVIAVIVVIVMLVKVVPSYMKLFDEMQMEMPGITMLVVNMSKFLVSYWYAVIAVIAAAVVGIRTYAHTHSGQRFFGNISRKLPVFGKLNVKTQASLFARTLSTLLYSGLSMVDALEIVSNTVTNAVYKDAIKVAKDEVMKGVSLSEPIENSKLFPPMVSHMTKIGEETGEIEDMLTRLANYYDEEVEMATQTVMAALEPMVIVFMAVIVIFLIAAVMSPMMSMYTGLDNL